MDRDRNWIGKGSSFPPPLHLLLRAVHVLVQAVACTVQCIIISPLRGEPLADFSGRAHMCIGTYVALLK